MADKAGEFEGKKSFLAVIICSFCYFKTLFTAMYKAWTCRANRVVLLRYCFVLPFPIFQSKEKSPRFVGWKVIFHTGLLQPHFLLWFLRNSQVVPGDLRVLFRKPFEWNKYCKAGGVALIHSNCSRKCVVILFTLQLVKLGDTEGYFFSQEFPKY